MNVFRLFFSLINIHLGLLHEFNSIIFEIPSNLPPPHLRISQSLSAIIFYSPSTFIFPRQYNVISDSVSLKENPGFGRDNDASGLLKPLLNKAHCSQCSYNSLELGFLYIWKDELNAEINVYNQHIKHQ